MVDKLLLKFWLSHIHGEKAEVNGYLTTNLFVNLGLGIHIYEKKSSH